MFGSIRNQRMDIVVRVGALFAICGIVVDMLDETRSQLPSALLDFANLGWMLLITSTVWLLARTNLKPDFNGSSSRKTTAVAFVAVAVCMATWSTHRLSVRFAHFNCDEPDLIHQLAPGMMVSEFRYQGVTDKGRLVDLFHFDSTDKDFEDYSKKSDQRLSGFTMALIHRDSPDRKTNCHGWVFTNGEYLLRGESVDRILEDNNYKVVSNPMPEDIIIYRSANGVIVHTGLVQGVLHEGTVIIESKWGVDQRFLHLPQDQPYSGSFKYYRSNRKNHLIQIRSYWAPSDDS